MKVPFMNRPLIQAWIFVLATLVAGHAWAQSGSATIPWTQLSSSEKKVLAPLKESWNQLPAARQHRMQKGAERWAGMSAEQRLKAQKRLKKWKQLGPERKKRIRESFKEFKEFPLLKRQFLRERRRIFQNLPREQRQHLREMWQNRRHNKEFKFDKGLGGKNNLSGGQHRQKNDFGGPKGAGPPRK